MRHNNKEFIKYDKRGAYHWEQISNHPIKSNAYVKARYDKCINLLKLKYSCELEGKLGLDMGCGDGVLTYFMWKNGIIATGIDNSDIAIKLAIEKHGYFNTNCKFIVGDSCNTREDSETYDIVLCSDVIEHVYDPNKLLKEIKRLLKPHGHAIISTPIKLTKNPIDSMHIIEWYREGFSELIGNIFECHEIFISHPLVWMEIMNRAIIPRMLINLMAPIYNVFNGNEKRWRYCTLQFAVVKK